MMTMISSGTKLYLIRLKKKFSKAITAHILCVFYLLAYVSV